MQFMTIFLVLLLSGCAVNITPQSFIYQDEKAGQQLNLQQISSKLSNIPSPESLSVISLTSKDGLQLKGVQLIHPQARANIILFGGNGMKISQASAILNHFALIPVNVVWFDYRGTGVSDKSDELTIEALKQDALLEYDFAQQHLPKNLPLVVHGLSMGSLIAGHISSQRKLDGLVLDGAINSVDKLVKELTPWWSKAFSTVTVDPQLSQINNGDLLKNYSQPLLLLIGEDDSTTPVASSRQLYSLSPSTDKTLEIIADTEHGQAMKTDEAISAYKLFLARLGGH